MTRRCGYIYINFEFEKPSKGRLASFFPVITIGRIFLLAVIIMFAGHLLVVQMLVICLSSIFIMTWVGFIKPYREPKDNSRQLVSEFTILMITNFLLTSSIASIDIDARPMIGWAIIGTVVLILVYN